jgi:hypothetical protein
MRVLVLAAALPAIGCGRVGFDAVGVAVGDAVGDASCMPTAEPAATRVVNAGDDLFALLPTLVAGDVVEVHAGTYTSPGFAPVTWSGTAAQPIIIRGAPGERPVLQGVSTQNVLDVYGSWFTIRGFEITGGDIGLRLHGTDHATLDDLRMHGLGNEGVTCNVTGMPCSAMTLRRLEIFANGGIGTAIAFGLPDGSCSPRATTVEGCFIHDLAGTNGTGIYSDIDADALVIRDNVIVRVLGPGIMVGGTPNTPTTIERNVVWTTTGDNGIQIEGEVVVRNNIVLAAAGYGIYSTQKARPPNGAVVIHNTVVGGPRCFSADTWTSATGQVIANNAFYCPTTIAVNVMGGLGGATFANNLVLGTTNVPSGVTNGASAAADLGDPTTAAVYPPVGSALIDAGDPAHGAADDFNGLPRDATPDVGAYEHSTDTNPGWQIVEGFKPLPVTGCP